MSNKINLESCLDELEKIAIDTATLASTLAGGKILLNSILTRYGHKLPLIKQLGQEAVGLGLRTGMQGKPMLHPATRFLGGILEAHTMGAYETAHNLGKTLGPQGIDAAKGALNNPQISSMMGHHAKLLQGVPTESTGARKVMDYAFSPVGQVAADAKRAVQSLKSKIMTTPPPAATSTVNMSGKGGTFKPNTGSMQGLLAPRKNISKPKINIKNSTPAEIMQPQLTGRAV